MGISDSLNNSSLPSIAINSSGTVATNVSLSVSGTAVQALCDGVNGSQSPGNCTDGGEAEVSSTHTVAETVAIAIVAVILMAVTVTGNFLVIVSYKVNRRLRSINNMFLVSLACSDLIIGLVSMTFYPIYMITRHWPLGAVLCDIWLCLDYTLSMASVANLLLICLDRYFSITRPFTYRAKRTRCRTRVFIVSAWVLSGLMWSPAIVIWPRVRERHVPEGQCFIQFFDDNSIITLVTAILAFYLPVVVMTILYGLIYRETTKCSQYLEYLKSYRRSRTHSLASPFLNLRRQANLRFGSGNNSPRLSSTSSFSRSRRIVSTNSEVNANTVASGRCSVRGNLPNKCDVADVDNVFSDRPRCNSTNSAKVRFNIRFGARKKRTSSSKVDEGGVDAAHQRSNDSNEHNQYLLPTPLEENDKSGKYSCNSGAEQRRMSDAERRKPSMPSSERKAGRTLSAILIAFIVTWLPYNVCVVYKTLCDDKANCIPIEVWDAAYYLCYINSTINPFCFALCNKTFRRTFVQLLSCRKRRRRPSYASSVRRKPTSLSKTKQQQEAVASSSSSKS